MTDDAARDRKRAARARQALNTRATRTTTPPGGWIDDAACRGAWNVFHPSDGDYTTALTYCQRCPVIAECLDYALHVIDGDTNTTTGLWGGKTPDERADLR